MQNKSSLNFIVAALFLCTAWTGLQLVEACQSDNKDVCRPFEDFSMFHKTGSQAISMKNDEIYDAKYAKKIINLPAGNQLQNNFLPFLYPPQSLPIISLLGIFDYNISLAIWFLLQITLLFYVLKPYCSQLTSILILPPFILLECMAGQNGMFFLALFLTTMNFRKTKPILSGIALGIFSIKPQLAIFLPILLLYERNWKVLAIAIITIAILTLISASIWGSGLWNDYIQLSHEFLRIINITPKEYITVAASPFMAFRMLHLSNHIAIILQALISLTVLGITWQMLKKCKTDQQIISLIASATLLFSSYSFIYDDIMLLPFCLILFNRNNTSLQRLSFIFMAFIPVIAIRLHNIGVPYAFFSIVLAFITATNLINRENNEIIST